VFLAKNYDENSKKADRDPRASFRNPTENPSAGVVGPMGSSSFSLPNVERALTEMEGGIGGSASVGINAGGDARKALGRSTTRQASGLSVPSAGASGSRTQVSSPTLPTSPSPTSSGQTQHEVLQNFFQSLLSSKDRVSGGASAPRTTSTSRPAVPPSPAPPTVPAADGNGSSSGGAEET
jgi:dynein light intermediate chain 1, cytosolic